MKKNVVIRGVLLIIILIPIIFHLWFAISMIYDNRQKTIDTDWVKQYKTTIKNDFTNINDIKVYYQFGKVHFDFKVNLEMSIDEYNSVVKKTRDLVLEETISKLYEDQTNLSIKFETGKDIYGYKSSYWIQTENTDDNPNEFIENNFKVWYLEVNDGPEIKMVF